MKNGFRVARVSHQQGNEAHALRLPGGVHAARGDDGQAENSYCDALAREKAEEPLTTATTMPCYPL